MTALVPAQLGFGDIERLAASIAKSGLFGIRTPDQAIALMAIAQAEGRHPALAARDYDVIQGRPAKKAEAMLRDFFEAGGKVEWHALTDALADATFSHPQGGSARISWDMERANKAGLTGKDNYKKFPRQMLRSRTVSEGVRTIWPLATSGMHVPEEAADMTPHRGPTIEHSETAEHWDRVAQRGHDAVAKAKGRTPEPPAESTPSTRDAINAEVPIEPTPRAGRQTISEWLEAMELALKDAGTNRVQVDRILFDARSMQIAQTLRNGALQRYNQMKAAAIERANPTPPPDEEVPEDDADADTWPGPDVRTPLPA